MVWLISGKFGCLLCYLVVGGVVLVFVCLTYYLVLDLLVNLSCLIELSFGMWLVVLLPSCWAFNVVVCYRPIFNSMSLNSLRFATLLLDSNCDLIYLSFC